MKIKKSHFVDITYCQISLPLVYTRIPLANQDGWVWLFPKAVSATACLKFVPNANKM